MHAGFDTEFVARLVSAGDPRAAEGGSFRSRDLRPPGARSQRVSASVPVRL